MDTTIRNLDEEAYRRLKARAALEGRTLGEAVSEAIRRYLASSASDVYPLPHERTGEDDSGLEVAEGQVPGSAEAPAVGAAAATEELHLSGPTLGDCMARLAGITRPDDGYLEELEQIQAEQPGIGSSAWDS